MHRLVNLNKRISGEELEKILKEAAEEMGWTAKTHDEHSPEYTLGSLSKDDVYKETYVSFHGRFLPQAMASEIFKGKSRDYFWINTGLMGTPLVGFASETDIEKFLNYVDDRV